MDWSKKQVNSALLLVISLGGLALVLCSRLLWWLVSALVTGNY